MNIEEIVGKMSAGELMSILNPDQIDERAELVLESGKMFDDAVRINQENVAPTLKYIYDEILPALGIDRKDTQPVGSVTKKLPGSTSGDLDIGIDANKYEFARKPFEFNQYASPIMDRLGLKHNFQVEQFSIRVPIVNFDGRQEGQFVQVDLMPTTNMKFQAWSRYAPKEIAGQKYIKGVIRNLVLEAASHAMQAMNVIKRGTVKKGSEYLQNEPVVWEEYVFYTPEGLNKWHKERSLMKNQPKNLPEGVEGPVYNQGLEKSKTKRQLVSDDPDKIAKLMFGPKVKGKDLLSWDGCWKAAHEAKWAKNPEQWKIFMDSLRQKLLDRIDDGLEMPDEMLDELGIQKNPDPDGGGKPANESTLVKEGGHRIPDAVRINQRNAKSTMDSARQKVMDFFGLSEDEISFLGSTGKKLDSGSSGDIDIAISKKALEQKRGISDINEWFDLAEEFGEKYGLEVKNFPQWEWQGTSVGYPISNDDGEQEGEIVQLDLIPVDNLKFQAWSQYGPAEVEGEKYVKGLVRNQIMTAAARVSGYKVLETGLVNGSDEKERPVKWERYSYSHEEGGLYKKTFERPLMKGKKGAMGYHVSGETELKDKRELVSDDPDEICEILFGVDSANMLTWEDAWNGVKKQGILKDPKRLEVFRRSLRAGIERPLKKGNIDYIPPELEEFLGLKPSDHEMVDESIGSTKDMTAIDTPRQAMTKIHQLTGSKLRKFLSDFIQGVNGSSLMIRTTPKIDGYPFRVAWLDGKVLMEISYSGLLDRQGAEATSSVHDHELNFFTYVEERQKEKMMKFVKGMGLDGVKLIGELLSNGDEFADDNGTITYVGTTYDASRLGKRGSLVVIDAKGMTKDRAFDLEPEQKQKVIDFACSELSDANASYFDINQFAQEVEVSASDFPDEMIQQLKTTPPEKMKKAQAEQIRDQINASMTDLMKRKFKNPDIMPADDGSLEGVAFELNGNLYGIHYQSWKDIRNGYFSEIDEMADFTKRFLSAITGKSDKGSLVAMVNAIRQNPQEYQAKYEELLPKYIERAQELTKNAETRTDLPRFIDKISKSRARGLPKRFDPNLLTTDVMSLVEMVDGKVVDQKGKTIALIPGSFRPPHKGHLDMIRHYAEICDEVIVAVSGQTNVASQRYDKFGRSMPNFVAGEILDIYCQAAHLDNVEIAMTLNPMNWISATVRHFSNCKVMFGLSKKDDTSRFETFTTDKFQSTLDNVEILPIEENAIDATQSGEGDNISASYVRDHIDDRAALKKVLPSELSDKQFEEVYSLLNPEGGQYPAMTDQSRADKFNAGQKDKKMKKGMTRTDESGDKHFQKVHTTRINKANIPQTAEHVIAQLKKAFNLPDGSIELVGSAGKKPTSGDLDIAIDQNVLAKANGLETPAEFIDMSYDVAEQLGVDHSINKNDGWTATSYAFPIENVDGEQPDQYVQIDLCLTPSMKFTKWGMFTPDRVEPKDGERDEDINPKGGFRNGLFTAIARGGHVEILKTADIPEEGGEQPVEMIRYDYDYRVGLYRIHRVRKQKKNGTYAKWSVADKQLMTNDPDKIVQFLYNDKSLTSDDILSPRDAWDALVDSDMWADPDTRHEIGRCLEVFHEYHPSWSIPSWAKFN